MAAAYVVEFQGCALVHNDDCDCDSHDYTECDAVVNEFIYGHLLYETFVTTRAVHHLEKFHTQAAVDDLCVDWYKVPPVYWWKPIRVVSVVPEDPDYLPFVEEHIAALNETRDKAGFYTVNGKKVYLNE